MTVLTSWIWWTASASPLMMTCHTVLRDPSEGQCHVLRRLCVRTDVVVVMSDMARHFLIDIYSCPYRQDSGHPARCAGDRYGGPGAYSANASIGATGAYFSPSGLLSRGKGIETVIRALPAVVEQHPNTLYVVLGETHPNVVRGLRVRNTANGYTNSPKNWVLAIIY